MTTWDKLRARIEKDCSIRCSNEFTSFRPGRHQKAAGAWSWASYTERAPRTWVGSQWPIKELLKAPKIVASYDRENLDWNIDQELK